MGVKYKVNENFFKNWTTSMAYVLGYWYADGSLENAWYIRGKYIRICSKNLSIIKKIKKLLKSEHKIVFRKPEKVPSADKKKIYTTKGLYYLRIGSHKLYNDLIKIGLTPRKSLTISFPLVPNKYLRHFVRGYFDGDGCIHIDKKGGLKIIFTCGNKKFLKELSGILSKNYKIHKHKVYNSNRSFQLIFRTKASLIILKQIYYHVPKTMMLERKYKIYKKYLSTKKMAT
jgi:intein-encoded DNA endonuclease-like protein